MHFTKGIRRDLSLLGDLLRPLRTLTYIFDRLLRLSCCITDLSKLPNGIYRALFVKLKLKLKNRHSSSTGFGRKSKRGER